MNIFDYNIADDLIQGISGLKTDFNERDQTVQYSFSIFTPCYPWPIHSEVFSTVDDKGKADSHAWLTRYTEVKETLAKKNGDVTNTRAIQLAAAEKHFDYLIGSLNRVLELLEPMKPTMLQTVNAHLDDVRKEATKLKELALL